MAQEFTNKQDLIDLLKAIKKYMEQLKDNYNLLQKSANICDVAMGSDDLSRKHIDDLLEAIVLLEKAAQEAENAAYVVMQAITDYDEIQ